MPKGIRNVAKVLQSEVSHTRDMVEDQVLTEAVADKDHLVTNRVLLPDQEEVVLSQADLDKDYAALLAFNEEPVEITIAEDSSDHPIDPVCLGCNGRQIFVKRGEATIIPRKFVESLCNPRIRVATRQTKNNLGEDATILQQSRSLDFPFSLVDKNPKGKKWLNALLHRG